MNVGTTNMKVELIRYTDNPEEAVAWLLSYAIPSGFSAA